MDLSFLGSRRFTPDEMELFSAVGRLLSLPFGGGEESSPDAAPGADPPSAGPQSADPRD
jgi:hypothetical protein